MNPITSHSQDGPIKTKRTDLTHSGFAVNGFIRTLTTQVPNRTPQTLLSSAIAKSGLLGLDLQRTLQHVRDLAINELDKKDASGKDSSDEELDSDEEFDSDKTLTEKVIQIQMRKNRMEIWKKRTPSGIHEYTSAY